MAKPAPATSEPATPGPQPQRQLSTKKHARVAEAEIVVDHTIDADELTVLGIMQAMKLDRAAAEREALTWRPDPLWVNGVTANLVNKPITVRFAWFVSLPLNVQNALDDGYLKRLFLGREARKQMKIPHDIPQPNEYRAVLAARDAALSLSADDVDGWWRWTRGAAIGSWTQLASWLAAFGEQRTEFCDPIDVRAVDSLLGKEDVYAAIREYERLERELASQPTRALVLHEQFLAARSARDTALQNAGFGSVAQFDKAANAFRVYFRARAVALIEHSLTEAEQVLRDARGQLGVLALERLQQLHTVRWHVQHDNDIVFKFDIVVNETMKRFGVASDSVHAGVIAEQRGKPGPSIWDRVIDIGLLVLSFVPGPIGFAARLVSTARDIGDAVGEYNQLDTAHQTGFTSEAPSIKPIVVAVATNIGPDIGIAAVGKGIKVLRGSKVAADVAHAGAPAVHAGAGEAAIAHDTASDVARRAGDAAPHSVPGAARTPLAEPVVAPHAPDAVPITHAPEGPVAPRTVEPPPQPRTVEPPPQPRTVEPPAATTRTPLGEAEGELAARTELVSSGGARTSAEDAAKKRAQPRPERRPDPEDLGKGEPGGQPQRPQPEAPPPAAKSDMPATAQEPGWTERPPPETTAQSRAELEGDVAYQREMDAAIDRAESPAFVQGGETYYNQPLLDTAKEEALARSDRTRRVHESRSSVKPFQPEPGAAIPTEPGRPLGVTAAEVEDAVVEAQQRVTQKHQGGHGPRKYGTFVHTEVREAAESKLGHTLDPSTTFYNDATLATIKGMPADEASLSVRDWLRQRGLPDPGLSTELLEQKIGIMKPDLVFREPGSRFQMIDVTSRPRREHLAKSILYTMVLGAP